MPIAIGKKTDTNDETNQFVNDKSLPFGKRLGMVSVDYESVILDYEGLSTRITNALKRIGIFNLGQLLNLSESEIRRGYSIGSKIADQIVDYVFFIKNNIAVFRHLIATVPVIQHSKMDITEIQKKKVLSHVNAYINDRTYTIQLNDNELQYVYNIKRIHLKYRFRGMS